MKPVVFLAVLCSLGFTAVSMARPADSSELDRDNIISVMKKVCDWQLANLPDETIVVGRNDPIRNTDWIRTAFFTGVMATYETTGEDRYIEAAIEWARGNEWRLGIRSRQLDDHCAGQTYAELFFIKKDPGMIAPFRATIDAYMTKAQSGPKDWQPGRKNWWWVDALFLSPPALARLSAATGDQKYLDYMNEMWWDATEFLYDREDHLYYRDHRYKQQEDGTWPRLSPNGKKIFWSRGNGWAMAGLVRVLQHMPQDFPDRERYVTLYTEMAEKIVSVQGEDGLWRSSLLDPVAYPTPETSGSGFFCYALAWGVNEEILDRDKYLPVVKRAWTALVDAVDKEGKLGWVQLVGKDPQLIRKEDTNEYGTGAFLLAGSEMAKLGLSSVTTMYLGRKAQ